MQNPFTSDLIPLWFATVAAGVTAVIAVLLARSIIDPLGWLVRHISASSFPTGAPHTPRRRVAIDARPMIGKPETDGRFVTYGIGHYVINMVKELVAQDPNTEYVLWSASWKVKFPTWYLDFVNAHHNVRAVHIRFPNHVVDFLSYWRFRFLHELVGVVDASYEANYFPIKPGDAYSICTVHDLSFMRNTSFRRSRAWQEDASKRAGLADKITTVSEASREVILDQSKNWVKNAKPENVVVIHGAPAEWFNPTFAQKHFVEVQKRYELPARYFICSGEPVARKNFQVLVDGFRLLRTKRPDEQLIMTGFDQAELVATIGGDLTNVRAIGYVPEEDLPSLYRGALALIYPSVDEGFGLPVVEAMSTGQVVVTSNIAALREVTGGISITAATNASGISRALSTVADLPPQERATMIERGLVNARRFSWKHSAESLLRLIHDGITAKQRFGKGGKAPEADRRVA